MSSQTSCPICGKRAKRPCPALIRPICSLCCATRRNLEIECSPDCSYNPYSPAGYDLWLKLDGRIVPRLIEKVMDEFGRDRFRKEMERYPSYDPEDEQAVSVAFEWAVWHMLQVEKDGGGRTLAERWEEEKWIGLEADQAQMMKYRRHTFITVIEIQRFLDHQRMECLDLFDPLSKPFILVDRTLPGQMVRFSRLFGRLTHYPHFSRPGVIALPLPEIIRDEFIEEIWRCSGQDPDSFDERIIKEYMADNFFGLVKLIFERPGEKMKEMLRGLDFHHCTAEYMLRVPRDEIEAILETKPDFRRSDREPEDGDPPGTGYYDWLRDGESRTLEKEMIAAFRHRPGIGQVGTLGNLKLVDDRLILETFSRQKYRFARKMLNKYFKGKLDFQEEKIVNLAEQVAMEREDGDGEEPPRRREGAEDEVSPEIKAEMMEQFYRERYTRILDEEIPALNGLTPRQAAADPLHRPLLVELMKSHLYGIEMKNREERMKINIDFALRELGLEELI